MTANRAWIEDCIVHLLCVLALDRFGDYVSDQARLRILRSTQCQYLRMPVVKQQWQYRRWSRLSGRLPLKRSEQLPALYLLHRW